MTTPTCSLAGLLFGHGKLASSVQALVPGCFPDSADDLAANVYPLHPSVWRSMDTPDCPAPRASPLLSNEGVRPEHIEWVLFDAKERRPGPSKSC